MATDLIEKINERRLERMRLGQSACEIVALASDDQIRVALVPLLESEYEQCMRSVSELSRDLPENVAGASYMDRFEKYEVLVRAIRDTNNLTEHVFDSVDKLTSSLQPPDINMLYDRYVEMSDNISPHVAQLGDEEIDFLKELFGDFQWNDLSGKQLYVLNRFISTLSPTQLMGKLPGSFSTI